MQNSMVKAMKAIKALVIPIVIIILLAAIFYYITVGEGSYSSSGSGSSISSGSSSGSGTTGSNGISNIENVRYVLEELFNSITIDSIDKREDGKGYTYYAKSKDNELITIEEKVDEIFKQYPKAYKKILSYISVNELLQVEKEKGIIDKSSDEEKIEKKAKELIQKFIKAEIIGKYPDLRTEEDIRDKKKVDENELQGGIKIVRNNSNENPYVFDSKKIEYVITEDMPILTYVPYAEFEQRLASATTEEDIKYIFSLKYSDEEEKKVDIVVGGWTKVTTEVVHTTSKGGYSRTEKIDYTFHEIKINYQDQLKQYDMPAGFLWSLFVTGESFDFVEKLADLAINETEIVIEAQDSISIDVETTVETYTTQETRYYTVTAEDGTTTTHSYTVTIYHTITTTVTTEQSNTKLELVFAETWVAIYKKNYNIVNSIENKYNGDWINNAEWKDLEDVDLGTTVEKSENPNEDKEYEELKNKIIEGVTVEKCKEILTRDVKKLNNENLLYYFFEWNTEQKTYDVFAEYMYNYAKGGFLDEYIVNTLLKSVNINSYVNNFWKNRTEEVKKFYSDKEVKKDDIKDELCNFLKNTSKGMITLASAETEIKKSEVDRKITTNVQTIKEKSNVSYFTVAQERQELDKEDNFIVYFNNNEKAKKLILETTSWFFEMLESHEKTIDKVDLFRYLLYKATNSSFGVTSYNFTEYDFNQFESSQMSSGTNCPRYYQNDDKWKDNSYNYKRDDGTIGTIGGGGCGACALAMAVSGLTEQAITPDIIVGYLNNLGINTVTNGTECAQKVAERYGLTYEKISRTDTEAINKALDSGKCLIFSVTDNGIYTGKGHYIMCNGRSENGGYYVLESAHYYETDRPYAFNQVFTPGNQGIFVLGK